MWEKSGGGGWITLTYTADELGVGVLGLRTCLLGTRYENFFLIGA